MKKQVEIFKKRLKEEPELRDKFSKLKTESDISEAIKPFLDGLTEEEFLGELTKSGTDAPMAKLDEGELDQVSGGRSTAGEKLFILQLLKGLFG
jgi:hypothetical protein